MAPRTKFCVNFGQSSARKAKTYKWFKCQIEIRADMEDDDSSECHGTSIMMDVAEVITVPFGSCQGNFWMVWTQDV